MAQKWSVYDNLFIYYNIIEGKITGPYISVLYTLSPPPLQWDLFEEVSLLDSPEKSATGKSGPGSTGQTRTSTAPRSQARATARKTGSACSSPITVAGSRQTNHASRSRRSSSAGPSGGGGGGVVTSNKPLPAPKGKGKMPAKASGQTFKVPQRKAGGVTRAPRKRVLEAATSSPPSLPPPKKRVAEEGAGVKKTSTNQLSRNSPIQVEEGGGGGTGGGSGSTGTGTRTGNGTGTRTGTEVRTATETGNGTGSWARTETVNGTRTGVRAGSGTGTDGRAEAASRDSSVPAAEGAVVMVATGTQSPAVPAGSSDTWTRYSYIITHTQLCGPDI